MSFRRIVKRHFFVMLVITGLLWTSLAALAFPGQRSMPYDDNGWGSVAFLITMFFSAVFWLPSQLVKLVSASSNPASHVFAALLAIGIAGALDFGLRIVQDRRAVASDKHDQAAEV